MAILYKPGKGAVRVRPRNGRVFCLEELKEMMDGGWIEIVRLPNSLWLVVDEEGRLKGLEPNPVVSVLAGQTIAGNALVATYYELEGRNEGEPEE